MKRTMVILLTVAMLLSITACTADTGVTGDDATTIATTTSTTLDGDTTTVTSTVSTTSPTTSRPFSTTIIEKTTSPSAIPTTTTTTVSRLKNEFSLGTVKNGVYENLFLGIGFRLDSTWTFYNEDQMKQLNNIAADMMGDELAEHIKNATLYYDMFAVHNNGMDNININMEKLNSSAAATPLKQRLNASLPSLRQALESMGYTDLETTLTTITAGGRNFTGIRTTGQVNGITLYQTLFCFDKGGYCATAAVTTYYEDSTQQLLNNLYVIQ